MLRSMNELLGYGIRSLDGPMGEVKDFYFEDFSGLLRYLVVDTGSLLPGKKVLISPLALGAPDWGRQVLPVNHTEAEVRSSPPIESEKPVSRQYEEQLHNYYKWTPYWASEVPVGEPAQPTTKPHDTAGGANPRLRSFREVRTYNVFSHEGTQSGSAQDFILDDERWIVALLVVNIGGTLKRDCVVLPTEAVEEYSYGHSRIQLRIDHDAVSKAHRFDSSEPINAEVEVRLYDVLGRPASSR